MYSVAVVILNYNGKHFLEKFLPSVITYSIGSQIIVADNKSTDGSIEYLQQNFPTIEIIRLIRNEGYSQGYNLALQQIKATYYILLNSDVEVTPNWLNPLIALMESDSQIAACQPKIKSYSDKRAFEYAGAAGGYIDKYGYPFCRGRLFSHVEIDNGQYNDTREVFWATGACMVVRAELFWLLGGLDPHFFAHMEEIDLCWRIKNAGYKIIYCAESTVFHVGGGTLPVSNPRKTFLNFRNGIVLLYKNLPEDQLWRIIFIRLVLDGVAAIQFLLTFSFANFAAVFKAHMSFYKNISVWKQQRKKSIRLAKGFAHEEIYKKSIVYSFFIEKKRTFKQLKF
ncbi:glycosyltransferase family 2 protein [Rhodocytophaga aerolata]|uniref:Glycosyltransferase family 2 protein n=1 Tax=Rhodocytophaga aerolata TaxID=455078 RepID=A0ABT8R6P1_9BACT|nr:glycosyltransferase family 2 protein [Rhodocytophaga aerolata]MDO1447619.1 glycosyltransferase family 2 protein [Rhodocytophaga aerolata]